MKAIERIKVVSVEATDAEYKEQRNADSYNALCDLRQKFGLMEEDMAEKKSEINYLMAEVSSLHAMVEELAKIIDEDRDPTKPTEGFE